MPEIWELERNKIQKAFDNRPKIHYLPLGPVKAYQDAHLDIKDEE